MNRTNYLERDQAERLRERYASLGYSGPKDLAVALRNWHLVNMDVDSLADNIEACLNGDKDLHPILADGLLYLMGVDRSMRFFQMILFNYGLDHQQQYLSAEESEALRTVLSEEIEPKKQKNPDMPKKLTYDRLIIALSKKSSKYKRKESKKLRTKFERVFRGKLPVDRDLAENLLKVCRLDSRVNFLYRFVPKPFGKYNLEELL